MRDDVTWKLMLAHLLTTLSCTEVVVGSLNMDPDMVHLLHVMKESVFGMQVMAEVLHHYGPVYGPKLKRVLLARKIKRMRVIRRKRNLDRR
ncbi:hypothetical protein [Mesorhizobium huakuii]|uniref:Uncharacterized protein n=1 Tax=Mesorhizobium huakuii TaxID=28104 RepID=A0A7G6T068_9HYPH|nr:hypothetical protein [Mesorhizobium huakuii]QND60150.1 hypothetical protein HB778_29095 [Mesorhizobium huakuii]